MFRLSTGSQPPRNMAGYVYLVKVRNESNLYKIGRTRVPEDRLRTFNVKLPFPVDILALVKTDNMYSLERMLHNRFSDKRANGEFFYLTSEDVQAICALQGNTLPFNLDDQPIKTAKVADRLLQEENERLRLRNLELETEMERIKDLFSKGMHAAHKEIQELKEECKYLLVSNEKHKTEKARLNREIGSLEFQLARYEGAIIEGRASDEPPQLPGNTVPDYPSEVP